MKKLLIPVFTALAAVGIAYSLHLIFFEALLQFGFNADGKLNGSSLFFNQKIFFFHTAHAMLMIIAVVIAGASSILFLLARSSQGEGRDGAWASLVGWVRRRGSTWDDLASSSVDVAVAFGAVALATGSIWAKAAWDVWWNWEPRLAITLLLWLILVGYSLVRRFAGPSADRVAAGMAIFGGVGSYFVYTMVGQDSHPAAGTEGVVATLGPGMRLAFWLSAVSFLFWYLALVLSRMQSTKAERELREIRERGLDLGVLQ